ncbi:17123_t:CDS:2 [Racocetra fulgida]|uniref:17123_t:CDS:1 n=1 Tax=Racocetra fulgida TaxID=60492 RepID=A0A9N9HS34_9GLOM|nr:17123_t:CDS:2 [Racocetra fulgida]
MREFQSEALPTDSTEAFNRWSRGINEAINSLNTEAQKNLKQAKDIALKLDIKIPFVPSLTVAKVVHDGLVQNFPTLLVEGDIVEMLYDDIASCRMKFISDNVPKEFSVKQLEQSQVFKPSFLWEMHIKNEEDINLSFWKLHGQIA